MAYEIVKRLKASKFESILEQLSQDVLPSDRRIGKLHNVFRDSFDAREIFNENMIIQKLEYMHHNPVSGKWNLVDDFTRYLHSSALFYQTGIHSIYPVTHYKDVWG